MGNTKNIIILIETPLNKRDYNRFGIDILMQNGFDVQVWDLTPFICPEDSMTALNDPVEPNICKRFTKIDDFSAEFSLLDPSSLIINLIVYRLRVLSVYRILSKSKLEYCVTMNNALPATAHKKPSLLYRINNSNLKQKLNYIFSKLPFQWFGVRPASLILLGGEKSLTSNPYPIDENTKKLWIHAFDYDLYLKDIKTHNEEDSGMAVFLDQYLPFHPDFIRSGSSFPATSEVYYPLLSTFFENMELETGISTVIAAHPRSRYEDHPTFFGKWSIIKGKTIELVHSSKVVLIHNSTAINFAVMFRKPMIFLTTEQLNEGWMGLDIESMASKVGKKPINLNETLAIEWNKQIAIDETAYSKYETDYIKRSNTPKLPFWQIFADYVKDHDENDHC